MPQMLVFTRIVPAAENNAGQLSAEERQNMHMQLISHFLARMLMQLSGGDNVDWNQFLHSTGPSGPPPACKKAIDDLPVIRVRKGDVAVSERCAICQDDYKEEDDVTTLPCKHFFHKDCVTPWLRDHHCTCPICRFKLETQSDSESERTPESVSEHTNTSTTTTTTTTTSHNSDSEEHGEERYANVTATQESGANGERRDTETRSEREGEGESEGESENVREREGRNNSQTASGGGDVVFVYDLVLSDSDEQPQQQQQDEQNSEHHHHQQTQEHLQQPATSHSQEQEQHTSERISNNSENTVHTAPTEHAHGHVHAPSNTTVVRFVVFDSSPSPRSEVRSDTATVTAQAHAASTMPTQPHASDSAQSHASTEQSHASSEQSRASDSSTESSHTSSPDVRTSSESM